MIILQCVSERSKLRVKFYAYIDADGKQYQNVYNNEYNCQFPKDIRADGRFFSIEDNDLNLKANSGTGFFYSVNKKNIKILNEEDLRLLHIGTPMTVEDLEIRGIQIYDVSECVVCLTDPTSIIFMPCGHCAVCENCNMHIKKKCPLCRRDVTATITK